LGIDRVEALNVIASPEVSPRVALPFMETSPVIDALPVTSKVVVGEDVPIPTLLFVASI
jgi:hypothetical protein